MEVKVETEDIETIFKLPSKIEQELNHIKMEETIKQIEIDHNYYSKCEFELHYIDKPVSHFNVRLYKSSV